MSRGGGVFTIDPNTGKMPVCYDGTRDYYACRALAHYSPNLPKHNAAVA
jgi:hypothetical protein